MVVAGAGEDVGKAEPEVEARHCTCHPCRPNNEQRIKATSATAGCMPYPCARNVREGPTAQKCSFLPPWRALSCHSCPSIQTPPLPTFWAMRNLPRSISVQNRAFFTQQPVHLRCPTGGSLSQRAGPHFSNSCVLGNEVLPANASVARCICGVWETVAGHRLGGLGGAGPLPPCDASLLGPSALLKTMSNADDSPAHLVPVGV